MQYFMAQMVAFLFSAWTVSWPTYSMDSQDYLLAAIFLRGMSNGGFNDTL
jgi:hypothetical protein